MQPDRFRQLRQQFSGQRLVVMGDVCGAGDTVISTYALAFVSGANPREAAELANFAAGTVVEEMGVMPVSPEKLEGLLRHHAMP